VGRTTSPERIRAFVSLGSNIDPWTYLPRAVELLATRLELAAVSSLYASAAQGQPESPPFLNAAVELVTDRPARELKFDVLRPLELEMGRVRTADPNAPRVIDLDLSLYGDRILTLAADGVEVPDPDLATTAHLILPLAEIGGDLRHPATGERLRDLARRFAGSADIHVVGRLRPPGAC
jgi:2-amino-4-hydroxy-6-hydroxymethyldihydropteridine diphosphokinase